MNDLDLEGRRNIEKFKGQRQVKKKNLRHPIVSIPGRMQISEFSIMY